MTANGMLPIAVLRGVWAKLKQGPNGNSIPYVFTNPGPDCRLDKCDRIFVLAAKQPETSIFLQHPKKQPSMEESKAQEVVGLNEEQPTAESPSPINRHVRRDSVNIADPKQTIGMLERAAMQHQHHQQQHSSAGSAGNEGKTGPVDAKHRTLQHSRSSPAGSREHGAPQNGAGKEESVDDLLEFVNEGTNP